MAEAGYTTRQVERITGLSARQLSYWRKTHLLVPSHQTRGGHARYTFPDLIALKAAKRLLDEGVPVQRIRRSILALSRFLPSVDRPLSELSLVATGDIVLVFQRDTAFDAVTGQGWILPVAEIERDLERIGLAVRPAEPLQRELFVAAPPAAEGDDLRTLRLRRG